MDTEDDGFVTVWPAVDLKSRAERAEAQSAVLCKKTENLRKVAEQYRKNSNEHFHRAERAEAENARMREALIKISNRPSCMVWGEDYEVRASVIEMEDIADSALKGDGDE